MDILPFFGNLFIYLEFRYLAWQVSNRNHFLLVSSKAVCLGELPVSVQTDIISFFSTAAYIRWHEFSRTYLTISLLTVIWVIPNFSLLFTKNAAFNLHLHTSLCPVCQVFLNDRHQGASKCVYILLNYPPMLFCQFTQFSVIYEKV